MTYQLYQRLIINNLPWNTPLVLAFDYQQKQYVITFVNLEPSPVAEATSCQARTFIQNVKNLTRYNFELVVETLTEIKEYVHAFRVSYTQAQNIEYSLLGTLSKVPGNFCLYLRSLTGKKSQFSLPSTDADHNNHLSNLENQQAQQQQQ